MSGNGLVVICDHSVTNSNFVDPGAEIVDLFVCTLCLCSVKYSDPRSPINNPHNHISDVHAIQRVLGVHRVPCVRV